MHAPKRRAASAFLAASLTIAASACGGGGSGGTPPPPTYTISGTVTGAASVQVQLSGAASRNATTDGAGRYAFPNLANGTYTVTPSKRGVLFSPATQQVVVAGADAVAATAAATDLVAYDDFLTNTISATRWDGGKRHALVDTQSALLGAEIAAPAANTGYASSLSVRPGAVSGRVTSASASIQIVSSAFAGDSLARASLDFLFQPLADRVAAPDNFTHTLIVRVGLQDSAAGLVAVRQVLACTSPSCSTSVGVGTVGAGSTWPGGGLAIASGVPYQVSISLDAATSIFTFTLSGGAYTTARSASVDLSAVASPPFTIDLSEANFKGMRLMAQVRGGASGGGDAAVEARFDEVAVGVNGAAPVLFDDFGAGTTFNPAKWSVGGEQVRTTPGALEISLDQAEVGGVTALNLASAPRALQADVKVTSWSQVGTGRVGARLAAALYNDGSPGLGTPPDVPGASSQVGDVIAQISMTATDVSYAVVVCKVAVCSGVSSAALTFVQPPTSLGTIALGEVHTLLLAWDQVAHTVLFQLDGNAPVFFDPVAAGHAVAAAPGKPFWQLSDHTGAAGPGVDFGAGSAGSITATFYAVKTL